MIIIIRYSGKIGFGAKTQWQWDIHGWLLHRVGQANTIDFDDGKRFEDHVNWLHTAFTTNSTCGLTTAANLSKITGQWNICMWGKGDGKV